MNFIADREDDAPQSGKTQVDAPASDYKPPSLEQTYAFPPNSDAFYPPPPAKKPISVSSYLPPPAGPANYPIFPGPITSKPVSSLHTQADNSGPIDSGVNDLNDMSEMNGNKDDNKGDMGSSNPDGPSDDTKLIDKPPVDFIPSKNPSVPSFPFLDHDHDHDHFHDHPHHDYHHFHDHEPYSPYDDSLKHLHGFEAFPGTNTSVFSISVNIYR